MVSPEKGFHIYFFPCKAVPLERIRWDSFIFSQISSTTSKYTAENKNAALFPHRFSLNFSAQLLRPATTSE